MSLIEETPPEAITGMLTAEASALVASTFGPMSIPSREISV